MSNYSTHRKKIAEFPIWPNDFKTMPIRENSNTNKIVQTVKLSTYQANTVWAGKLLTFLMTCCCCACFALNSDTSFQRDSFSLY